MACSQGHLCWLGPEEARIQGGEDSSLRSRPLCLSVKYLTSESQRCRRWSGVVEEGEG